MSARVTRRSGCTSFTNGSPSSRACQPLACQFNAGRCEQICQAIVCQKYSATRHMCADLNCLKLQRLGHLEDLHAFAEFMSASLMLSRPKSVGCKAARFWRSTQRHCSPLPPTPSSKLLLCSTAILYCLKRTMKVPPTTSHDTWTSAACPAAHFPSCTA